MPGAGRRAPTRGPFLNQPSLRGNCTAGFRPRVRGSGLCRVKRVRDQKGGGEAPCRRNPLGAAAPPSRSDCQGDPLPAPEQVQLQAPQSRDRGLGARCPRAENQRPMPEGRGGNGATEAAPHGASRDGPDHARRGTEPGCLPSWMPTSYTRFNFAICSTLRLLDHLWATTPLVDHNEATCGR